MNTLFILNDGPYGSERSYNALRLAGSLVKREGEEVRLFLIGDAAACAKGGQKVPQGYYNIADMLGAVTRRRGAFEFAFNYLGGTQVRHAGQWQISVADLVPLGQSIIVRTHHVQFEFDIAMLKKCSAGRVGK